MIGVRGRTNAERTLDDICTITRAVPGTWTPEAGLPSDTTTIHEGPCSLLPARDRRRSTAGGDDRVRYTHEITLPADATGIAVGDQVTVASQTEPYTVVRLDERSHQVLQRLGLVASRDAEGVEP
jgi:hypothetical protein